MHHFETIINKGYTDINPVQFGYEDCEKAHGFGPAIRTHWLLHFVVSGQGYFKIDGREYTLFAGDIFVIPPFVETYYQADDEKPWEYIWVGFTASLPLSVLETDIIHIPAAAHIFEDMKRCFRMQAGKTEFLCAKIWHLFSMLEEKNQETVDPIKNAVNIIDSEYMSDSLSIQSIADRVGLERTYFSNLFKQKTGFCPKQYLLRCRMEQAADLIKKHSYTVTVVALSVGYSDVYIFSKMFKRYFGISPTDFAKSSPKEKMIFENIAKRKIFRYNKQ